MNYINSQGLKYTWYIVAPVKIIIDYFKTMQNKGLL